LHMDPAIRPESLESRYLLSDWIGEHVELCVTDEVFLEINLLSDQAQRAIEQAWAATYRNLSRPNQNWREVVPDVAAVSPRAGGRDHQHIARASVAGAKYFVTRDEVLIGAADSIEAAVGIRVLRPEALVVRLDQQRADSSYRPVALQGTELRQSLPSDDLHEPMLSVLLNHGEGERRTQLNSLLRPIFVDRGNHDVRVVQSTDGTILAGFARRAIDGELEVPFLRVAPGAPGATVIARQLLFAQRKEAADLGLGSVKVTDPHPSRDIRDAFPLEHFSTSDDGGWVCSVKAGLIDHEDASSTEAPLDHGQAIAYEQAHWPAKVMGAEINNFLIPIKVAFAEALFDFTLAEHSLLPRQIGLGLNREHVYYRKTQNSRGISSGARILWYVTGNTPTHSRGSIRAVSLVEEVVVGNPRTLHARFERFGIYTVEQVCGLADRNNQVMAIRFVDTEVLRSPLPIEDLRALWSAQGESFSAPPSPTLIGEHMFCLVYERSSAYGS
jgi:hypothetical protein